MTSVRKSKLEQLLRQLIANLLLTGVLKDYRMSSNLLVRAVAIAKDFSSARVYISSFDEEKLEQGVSALNHAAGFIRHQIAPKLRTRSIPTLSFFADYSIKEGSDLCFKMDRDIHLENSDLNK